MPPCDPFATAFDDPPQGLLTTMPPYEPFHDAFSSRSQTPTSSSPSLLQRSPCCAPKLCLAHLDSYLHLHLPDTTNLDVQAGFIGELGVTWEYYDMKMKARKKKYRDEVEALREVHGREMGRERERFEREVRDLRGMEKMVREVCEGLRRVEGLVRGLRMEGGKEHEYEEKGVRVGDGEREKGVESIEEMVYDEGSVREECIELGTSCQQRIPLGDLRGGAGYVDASKHDSNDLRSHLEELEVVEEWLEEDGEGPRDVQRAADRVLENRISLEPGDGGVSFGETQDESSVDGGSTQADEELRRQLDAFCWDNPSTQSQMGEQIDNPTQEATEDDSKITAQLDEICNVLGNALHDEYAVSYWDPRQHTHLYGEGFVPQCNNCWSDLRKILERARGVDEARRHVKELDEGIKHQASVIEEQAEQLKRLEAQIKWGLETDEEIIQKSHKLVEDRQRFADRVLELEELLQTQETGQNVNKAEMTWAWKHVMEQRTEIGRLQYELEKAKVETLTYRVETLNHRECAKQRMQLAEEAQGWAEELRGRFEITPCVFLEPQALHAFNPTHCTPIGPSRAEGRNDNREAGEPKCLVLAKGRQAHEAESHLPVYSVWHEHLVDVDTRLATYLSLSLHTQRQVSELIETNNSLRVDIYTARQELTSKANEVVVLEKKLNDIDSELLGEQMSCSLAETEVKELRELKTVLQKEFDDNNHKYQKLKYHILRGSPDVAKEVIYQQEEQLQYYHAKAQKNLDLERNVFEKEQNEEQFALGMEKLREEKESYAAQVEELRSENENLKDELERIRNDRLMRLPDVVPRKPREADTWRDV